MGLFPYWPVLVMAFAAGTGATWLMRRAALRLGVVDHPNPIVPQHTRATAYLGGLGVALAAGFTLALFGCFAPEYGVPDWSAEARQWPLVVGAVLYLVLGLADDLRTFSPPVKFALQALAVLVVLPGLVYPLTGILLGDAFISALWILAVVNALNFTDVCDGLAGGLSVVMLLCLAWLRVLDPVPASALAGACLGFLVFNCPPARIFLGDAGSQMLGFVLAASVILGGEGREWWPYLPAMLLVLSVPLFELVFLTVVRIRQGLPWWQGSPDHFSLRLQAAGCSRLHTDLIAWSAAGLGELGAGALLHFARWPAVQGAVLAGVLVWLVWAWRLLRRYPVRR